MPYSGVPSNLTAKMERCVSGVMAKGRNKSSAIAICHNSVTGASKKNAYAKKKAKEASK